MSSWFLPSSWSSWLWSSSTPSASDKSHGPPQRRLPNGNILVVSIDGGGLRGVLPATLIDRIEHQQRFLDHVDVFTGTSTGALVAMALAAGRTPREIVDMYCKMSAEVFAHSILQDISDVEGMLGPSYAVGQANLKKHLEDAFGEMTLGDVTRKVIVPVFDLGHPGDAMTGQALQTWTPKYLTNFGPDAQPQLRVVDVILQTSAAPTYFPSFQNCIDGGMVANNPSMLGLAHVVASRAAPLEKISLLSLGTGLYSQCLEGPILNWGVVQWAPHLLDIIFDGTAEVAAHQCAAMLGPSRFRRINPRLPAKIGMDDTRSTGILQALGEEIDITQDVSWLTQTMTAKNLK